MDKLPFDDLRSVQTLRDIMRALRTPETGCPWDLEQDFSSIAPYTVEEAYEVADAIERNHMGDLCDELGDLLLQVVYHSQMAAELEHFTFDDVVEAICAKMIRRHPHVFGDAEARTAGAVKGFWEAIKLQESSERSHGNLDDASTVAPSALDGIPIALPALLRAVKLQRKAARVGFDWPELAPVIDKIEEELNEIKGELEHRDRKRIEEEIGDLLFAVVNLARHLRIEPEAALHAANAKFSRRFRSVEQQLVSDGKRPGEASLEHMDTLWNAVKRKE